MQTQRRSAVIYAIIFLDLLAFGIVVPQLGIYAKHFGASALTQGLLVGCYSAMQFLFAPLLGRWSDRIGRRPVLLISLLTSFAGHVLFALAHSLPLLFAARLIDGLGGANVSTAQAYLSDVTPNERRAKAMAAVGMSFGMGFILGPVVGAVLAPWGTHHWGAYGGNLAIGLVAAGCSLATLLLTALWLPESLPAERRHDAERPLRLIDLASLRSAWGMPAVRSLLLVNLISWAVCCVFTLQPSITLLIAGCFVWMFLGPYAEAAEQTTLQKVVPFERQGRVFGFAQSVEQAASPLTAFLIGPLTQFIFIPLMTTGAGAEAIGDWFGRGEDRGIALVFTLAGVAGVIVTLIAFNSSYYRQLARAYAKGEGQAAELGAA